MKKQTILLIIGPLVHGLVAGQTVSPAQNELKTELQSRIVRYNLPAIGVLVIRNGTVMFREVAGTRKLGNPTKAKTSDLFHIGSITKSMTATVAAMFVEEGKLQWDTTIPEVFGENVHAGYRHATLEQLLRHESGTGPYLPTDFPALWRYMETSLDPVAVQRLRLVRTVTAVPPRFVPGSAYEYSNAGYVIAGAMLEKKSGKPWEEIMRVRLFQPLRLRCGFGVPGKKTDVSQPWPHWETDGRIVPSFLDNPASLGPAGTVHCDLDSLGRYAKLHLDGALGDGALLRQASFKRLHTASLADNGMGWGVGSDSIGADGNNRLNHARIRILPKIKSILVLVTNRGDQQAVDAIDELDEMITELYFR